MSYSTHKRLIVTKDNNGPLLQIRQGPLTVQCLIMLISCSLIEYLFVVELIKTTLVELILLRYFELVPHSW